MASTNEEATNEQLNSVSTLNTKESTHEPEGNAVNVPPPNYAKRGRNLLLDVNPEADNRTAFERRLPYAGGESKLALSHATPKVVIDREIQKTMKTKRQRQFDSKLICFKMEQRANPKGVSFVCEMCPKMATLCCTKCMVTYYCGWTHRKMDSIHALFCERLKIIRWPLPVFRSKSEKERIQAQKLLVMEKLLEDMVKQSFMNLYGGKFLEALGTLQQSIRYIDRVFGPDDCSIVQTMTLHTTLSEALLGSKYLEAAEKSLKNALVLLWRAEDIYPDISLNLAKARINNTQGLLSFARGKLDDAIFHFSECIYFVTEYSDPKDARACVGYFNLAKSFLAMSKKEEGISLLKFCLELWLKYIVQKALMNETTDTYKQSSVFSNDGHKAINPYLELEATRQLDDMWNLINEQDQPLIACQTILCQGSLLFFNMKYTKSRAYANWSIRICQTLPNQTDLFHLCKHLEKHAARREAMKMMTKS